MKDVFSLGGVVSSKREKKMLDEILKEHISNSYGVDGVTLNLANMYYRKLENGMIRIIGGRE